MNILQTQIDVLMQDCRTMFEQIPASFWKTADGKTIPGIGIKVAPLSMYSNKYASFAWLKYHDGVYIGGQINSASEKDTIHFFPKELQVPGSEGKDVLEWFAQTAGNPPGWAPVKSTEDYVIAPV